VEIVKLSDCKDKSSVSGRREPKNIVISPGFTLVKMRVSDSSNGFPKEEPNDREFKSKILLSKLTTKSNPKRGDGVEATSPSRMRSRLTVFLRVIVETFG